MYSSDGRYASCATTRSASPRPSTTRNSQCRRAPNRTRLRVSSPNQRSRHLARGLAASGTGGSIRADPRAEAAGGTPADALGLTGSQGFASERRRQAASASLDHPGRAVVLLAGALEHRGREPPIGPEALGRHVDDDVTVTVEVAPLPVGECRLDAVLDRDGLGARSPSHLVVE